MEKDEIKTLLGKKIRELRKKRGLTQAQLAEVVNVDNKHISCVESGKNFPSPDLLSRFSIAFRVEPKDLFEFYHLQEPEDLLSDLWEMMQKLRKEDLVHVYKIVRTYMLVDKN